MSEGRGGIHCITFSIYFQYEIALCAACARISFHCVYMHMYTRVCVRAYGHALLDKSLYKCTLSVKLRWSTTQLLRSRIAEVVIFRQIPHQRRWQPLGDLPVIIIREVTPRPHRILTSVRTFEFNPKKNLHRLLVFCMFGGPPDPPPHPHRPWYAWVLSTQLSLTHQPSSKSGILLKMKCALTTGVSRRQTQFHGTRF